MEKEKEYLVHVQYCTNCHSHSWCTHHNQAKYHQTFIKLKNLIYQQFKTQKSILKVICNKVPKHFAPIKQQQNKFYDSINKKYVFYPNIGSFQVTINGQNIFSKKKDNSWPVFDSILDLLTLKIRNQERLKKQLQNNPILISSQNQTQFQLFNNKKSDQKTLYKQKIPNKQEFSLTSHFKAYYTHGSSTTIGNQYIQNDNFSKQKIVNLKQSGIKINVQNIEKLKEALKIKQNNQTTQINQRQTNLNKQILINLSSIEEQNSQNINNQRYSKFGQLNKSQQNKGQCKYQSKIIASQKSLSRKKLQQWQFDLNSAENKFTKIQNKVKIRDSRIPNLQIEINQNPNQQIQTNINSSLRQDLSRIKKNKDNVQSPLSYHLSIFQNLKGSRFKSSDIQQEIKNWKLNDNIVQSKKMKEIQVYIQANQQYKNQKLRKIYGNWKFQGTYSQHMNSQNAYKLNYKKGVSTYFKIKKNKNKKTDQNKQITDKLCNNKCRISEDEESSDASTVCLKNKNEQEYTYKQNNKIKNLSSQHVKRSYYAKNNICRKSTGYKMSQSKMHNKIQSKSLNKVDNDNNIYTMEAISKYIKPKRQNAIQLGAKRLYKKFQNNGKHQNFNKKSFKSTKNYQQISQFKVKDQNIPNQYTQNQLNKKVSTKKNQILSHVSHHQEKGKRQNAIKDKSKQQLNNNYIKKSFVSSHLHNKNKQKALHTLSNIKSQKDKIDQQKVVEKQYIVNSNVNFGKMDQINQKEINGSNKNGLKSSRLMLSKNQINIILQSRPDRQQCEELKEEQLQKQQSNNSSLQQRQIENYSQGGQNSQSDSTLQNKQLSNNPLLINIVQIKNPHLTNVLQIKQKQQSNHIQNQISKSEQSELQAEQLKGNQENCQNKMINNQNKTLKKSNFAAQFMPETENMIQDENTQKQQAEKDIDADNFTRQKQQHTYKLNFKQSVSNLDKQTFARSHSLYEPIKNKQQQQACKCTVRLEKSQRKNFQSQQKILIKRKQNQKKYIQTKRRRQILQKQRQQYLLKKQESKLNRTSNHTSFQEQFKAKKSHTTNIYIQNQNNQSNRKNLSKSRSVIRKNKQRQPKKNEVIQKQKQHSKTFAHQYQFKNKLKTQRQQIVEQNNKLSFLKTNQRDTEEVSKSPYSKSQIKKSSKTVKSCRSKTKKNIKYLQTVGIQTVNFNQVSVQTDFWIKCQQINHQKLSDNCYASSKQQPLNTSGKINQEIFLNEKDNNALMNSINIQIKSSQIKQQSKKEKQFYLRNSAPILKQLYGESIEYQAQQYQKALKQNKLFLRQTLKIQQKLQVSAYDSKSLCEIYNFDLKLFDNELNLQNFKSNSYENINFMKTVLMLANKNQLLIVRLFQDYKQNIIKKQQFQDGYNIKCKYGVWICLNYRWKMVIVNDYIPVKPSNQLQSASYKPIFCQVLNQCVWPIILQKAMALAVGGYDNYLKLSCSQLFHMLTGCNYIQFKISEDLDKNKQFLKYISQNQRKNYLINCQKNVKNIKEHQQILEQIKVFSLISKKTVNNQQVLFKIQETSSWEKNSAEPYYMKYQRFFQSFRSCQIFHLRQYHNYCQLQLANNSHENNDNSKKFFFVAQLCFDLASFGCVTISNRQKGSLKSYLYKEQNGDSQLLRLIGQVSKSNKKQLFFDCCFQQCKYFLFVQTQHSDSTISYLGEGKPTIIIKEQILQKGLKNNITEYLPVSANIKNTNEFNKTNQLLGLSKVTKIDKYQPSHNINTSKGFQQLRQKFIELIVHGKNA